MCHINCGGDHPFIVYINKVVKYYGILQLILFADEPNILYSNGDISELESQPTVTMECRAKCLLISRHR